MAAVMLHANLELTEEEKAAAEQEKQEQLEADLQRWENYEASRPSASGLFGSYVRVGDFVYKHIEKKVSNCPPYC